MSKNLEAADTVIKDCLDNYVPPVVDESWERKLDALRDFTALAWYNVGQKHLTATEASDAIDDFIIMLEGSEPMRYLGEDGR